MASVGNDTWIVSPPFNATSPALRLAGVELFVTVSGAKSDAQHDVHALLPTFVDMATSTASHNAVAQNDRIGGLRSLRAYLRLMDQDQSQHWDNRGHFFAAAAEAMRRILVENARRKKRIKRGGNLTRKELPEFSIVAPQIHEDLIALDASLKVCTLPPTIRISFP